jgi:hypothetical protein
LDDDTLTILKHDAQRTKARLQAIEKQLNSERVEAGQWREMRKLCNMLPVYLRDKLFKPNPNSGLITPMRRMIARFEPIQNSSYLGYELGDHAVLLLVFRKRNPF